MDRQHPIFTEKKECQDCYKCVRNCPVKAIRVENGSAMVMTERCVACGKCVATCPVQAKRVRDDMGRVRHLLETEEKVVVSLAPSYVSEFPDIPPAKLIAALRKLGFAAVSETALGAQDVSATVAEALRDRTPRVLLSSACPVVVELVNKYMPHHAERVTNLCSPLLAHCRLLKDTFGEKVKIVFIGPCIAKKLEADEHPDLLDIAISFLDLRNWLEAEHIHPITLTAGEDAVFEPEPAREGALYPVDGGMIAGIKANCTVDDAGFMALSGFENVRDALRDLDTIPLKGPLFLELLACEGGCVNGPQTAAAGATVLKRYQVFDHARYSADEFPRAPKVDAALDRHAPPVEEEVYSDRELRDALATVGKYRPDDELNCNGCGYPNCRDFAAALLAGKAEATMCVSYMRKLAQKKANALIQAMPSGVLIVNADLSIVECNRRLAEILGGELPDIYDARPGLEGAAADRVAPFLIRYIRKVLESGEDIVGHDVRYQGAVYNLSVFAIEPGRIAGAVVQDVTAPAVHKDRVVRKAQEVIHRQMETVQKIAYLLGENAAESQVGLNAIIESFSTSEDEGSPTVAERDLFVEVEHFQASKHGEPVPGDVFLTRKVREDDRLVSVLADGLGSGVKANVLATLTSTMALEFVADGTDIELAARTVMDVLPVCRVRQIAYSTFTIVDIVGGHRVRVIEHENPPFFVLRGDRVFEPERHHISLPSGVGNVPRERDLEVAHFEAEDGDRLVYFSDGVNQSGMGSDATPLGLGCEAVMEFARHLVRANPNLSARELARRIVDLATAKDGGSPRDDISCAVVYFRQPRHLLLATGPPFSEKSDIQMAETVGEFEGTRIVCGGTTAAIVSRELARPVTMNLDVLDDDVPPISRMEGINLVTEGTITVARVLDMLERDVNPDHEPRNGATLVLEYLLNSDVIHFLVGTRINEAHQDPNIPVELDLRRNLMKRVAALLEERHLKETRIQYI